MKRKMPFFLITTMVPIHFLSMGFQNNDYFEIHKSANQITKSKFANFTTVIENFEVERQPDSVYFEWFKNQKNEVRKLESYWFDKEIAKKVYHPGAKPEINTENYAFEYCKNLENCRNWQFYWEEKKFRHWKEETIFSVYGEYDNSVFDKISLKIGSKSQNNFDVTKSLNQYAKEKINELEKNTGAKNFKISDLIYRIGFEITEDKIKNFTINLQFNYNYQKPVLNSNAELTEYLENLRQKFNNEVLKNNKIILETNDKNKKDYEIRNFSLNQGSETLEKIKEKAKELSEKLFTKFNNQKKYNSSLQFNVTSDTTIEFFLNFQHPQDKNYYNFILNQNVNINFSPEKHSNKDEFWKRLTVIPGQIYDQNIYEPKTDEPIKIQTEKKENEEKKENIRYIYGGKWEYHDKIKLNFFADENENEILYVNGKPIDVLDLNFNYVLEDLRLDRKNEKNAINNYKIEIKKFEKSDKTQDNSKLIAVYEIEFVIKSANSIMDIKWFAWDPQNNKEQQKLIEPYLKDANGNLIYDHFGTKIKNPKFDPLIDPQTGTKKQILWVSTGNKLDSLPENSNFAQLPNEISRLNLGLKSNIGFIAEGSVSGKGANITLNSLIENKETWSNRYQINSNNNENFEILSKNSKKFKKFDITNSTNKYFSNSGIWLFSSQFDKGLSSYKIVSIGENSSSQLFSDIFPNKSIIPFWESKPGQILAQSLLSKKMSWNDIKKLSYEQILLYWRNFIEKLVKKQSFSKINSKFDTGYLIKNRIISAIKRRKIAKNSENLRNTSVDNDARNQTGKTDEILEINPEMKVDLLKIILNENEKINENQLKIENVVKNHDGTFNFDVNITNKKQKKLKFTNIKVEKENGDESKTKINFDIEKINLPGNEHFDNFSEIINHLSTQKDADKVDIVLEKENDKIFANFKIKNQYKNKYFVEKPFILLKKLPEASLIFEDQKNIFEELDLDRINLAGILHIEKAKKFILDEIDKSWKKIKYRFNFDFVIDNFDETVEKIIKNVEENDQIPHKVWNLELRVKAESTKNFYGSKVIKLVNIIGSLTEPKIQNLNQIRATQFNFSVLKHSNNLEKALKDHVYNLLLPEEIDAKKYLYLKNLEQIAHNFRLNPNLDRATLILEPGTSQLNGKKELTVFNSDFSPLGNLNVSNLNPSDNSKNIFKKETTWYWLIPLIIFMTLGVLFLGFWIYNKFIAKFKH